MAFKALGPAALEVTQAVRGVLELAKQQSKPVRIGVSGGQDSLALAAAVAHLCRKEFSGLDVEALNINHQLQPGADQVSDRVVEILQQLGLSARSLKVHVPNDGSGMEAAARAARLTALTQDFDGFVLLGHSLDDQAETVLLRLARGSGARSLSGIPRQNPWGTATLVRPLLGLRRSLLGQAVSEWQLPVWDDPQNEQDRFARVRVRNSSLPKLEADLGPGVAESLARTAELARIDADALDEMAIAEFSELPEGLRIDRLLALPEAIATRVIRIWATRLTGTEITFQHVSAIWQLVVQWRGQQGVDLPGGIRVQRVNGELISIG